MFVARAQKIAPILKVLVACLVLATIVVRAADGPTDAGTVISNRAEATYTDDTGSSYEAVTETVTVTVMHVATIVVTPDETESSDTVAPHDQVTRLFRVCNAGNNSDTVTPTKFDLTTPASLVAVYIYVQPVIGALMQWGDRYLAPDGPPRLLQHRGCGGQATLTAICSACGRPLAAHEVETVPGPGSKAAAN